MNTKTETQLEFDFMKPEQLDLNLSNIYTVKSTNHYFWKPACNVTFHGKNQQAVGSLDWSDGTMKFTGDADESAQLFFDNIIKQYIQTQIAT
jgi:hypothetical protein